MLRRSVQILGHLGRKVNGLPTSREAKPALNRVTDLLGLVQSQTAPAKWIMPEPLLMKRSRHRVMMKCRGMRKKKMWLEMDRAPTGVSAVTNHLPEVR